MAQIVFECDGRRRPFPPARRDRLRRRRRRRGFVFEIDHRRRRRRRRLRRRRDIFFGALVVVVIAVSSWCSMVLSWPPFAVARGGSSRGPDLGGPKTAQIGSGLAGPRNRQNQ